MDKTYWPNGAVKEQWDADLAVDKYSSFDDQGVLLEERNLTQEEWDAHGTKNVNRLDLETRVAAQVPDLLVMIEDLQARLDIPKADLTNTELRRTIRDVRKLARVVTQLARLVGRVLDSTDSGTP